MELQRSCRQGIAFPAVLRAGEGRHLRIIEPSGVTENAPDEWAIEDVVVQGHEGDEITTRILYTRQGQRCFILPVWAESIEFRYEGAGFAGHIVMIITMDED